MSISRGIRDNLLQLPGNYKNFIFKKNLSC